MTRSENSGPDPRIRTAALNYARRGWPLIPIWWPARTGANPICACRARDGCPSIGKHPIATCVPRGLKDASTDPAVVSRWWNRYPNANVGLLTGIHFDVVDIDGAEGLASIVAWEKAGYSLADFLAMVETGRGVGWHLYIKPSGRGCAAHAAPGVDYRGTGGYVVAPPSLHASGRRYLWCPDRIQPLREAVA